MEPTNANPAIIFHMLDSDIKSIITGIYTKSSED